MILFIDNEPNAVLETRIQFYKMGIFTQVLNTKQLHSILNSPAKAVLIMRPECIENLESVCAYIRSIPTRPPFAMMYRPPHGNYYTYLRMCDRVFEDNITTTKFIETMFELYEERKHRDPYIYEDRQVSIHLKNPQLMAYRLSFIVTHEQWMIVRYLLMHSPFSVCIEDLRRFCFRPDRTPALSTVRSQISRLNQMFVMAYKYPLIFFQHDLGYFICPI